MNKIVYGFVATSALIITACGGSGGNGSGTGTLAIGITDAPIDNVTAVIVQFSGVTVKPSEGSAINYVFDSVKTIDLLTLQGGNTAELLSETTVPVGHYEWVRLAVNANFDTVFDSYAMTPTGQVELRVPSGDNSGLKLVSGFTVTQGHATHVVIDWDVMRALSDPQGQPGYHLRPALRIADMARYGTLRGSVADALVMDESCINDLAADTGNAVYVYPAGATITDMNDSQDEPLATAMVKQNQDSIYAYAVHFLSVGDYTAAFTCQAGGDDPVTIQLEIEFTDPQAFSIQHGVTTIVDFK